ncbi:hypothetical protein F5884DRAFT_52721 [Xylogone sp. PMI_703]|nr:hypothetical protein F5884DRAFT_52721 [Xylogone sp. PMI_703]
MAHKSALVSFALFTIINGYAINIFPAQTSVSVTQVPTSIPEPTAAASLEELRRRQQVSPFDTIPPQQLLAAPDGTCGYLSGSIAEPWGCQTGNCVFATRNSSNTVGSVLCCDASTGCPAQPAPTACVDYGRYNYNVTCTGSCPTDPMTLKCTSGISVYCNLLAFADPAPATAYFCNYLSNYSPIPASTTYAGQTSHSFTPTSAKFVSSTTVAPSNSSANATAVETSSTSSFTSKPTAAKSGGGGGGGTSKGVIAGAAVGGVAGGVILTIVALAIFNRRRSEPQPAVAEPVAQVASRDEKPLAPAAAAVPVAAEGGTTSNSSSAGSERKPHRSSHRSSAAHYR